jgi:hypothetical protein
MSKFTRRELAVALSTTAIAFGRPQAQAQPQPPAANSEEELKAARAEVRDNAEQLDKFALPLSAEPATTFKP